MMEVSNLITRDKRELNKFEIEFKNSYQSGQGLDYINKLLEECKEDRKIELKKSA